MVDSDLPTTAPASASGVRRSWWTRFAEPIFDGTEAPDVLRRIRLTGRFSLLNLIANTAFLLNDLLVVRDRTIIVIDLLVVPFFFWLHIRYLRKGDQRTTARMLLASLNLWLFFNASYYGEECLIFLFLYTLILMTFFLIDHRDRISMAVFMALPVLGLVTLELSDHAWFANRDLSPHMVEQTRLLAMGTNLLILYTFLDGIVRNTRDGEQRLLAKQQRLRELTAQLQELNTFKENFNRDLQTRLNTALREVQEKERELDRAVLHGEEQERSRIAQDLHDGVGATLSTLKLRLGDLGEMLDEQHQAHHMDVMALIDVACEEVRNASHALHPLLFAELGLVNVLRDLVQRINARRRMRVDLQADGYTVPLSTAHERQLYRITLELINNTLRHATAEQLSIHLASRDGQVILTVEDDGRGYDPANIRPGLGLMAIEHRTAALNGSIQVETAPGRGVLTIVEVPLT